MDDVDPQLRLWLDFTAVNNEIASVRWDFRLETLERLRRQGLHFADTTIESVTLSQSRFVADSERVQRFVADYQAAGSRAPRLIFHRRRSEGAATVQDSPADEL